MKGFRSMRYMRVFSFAMCLSLLAVSAVLILSPRAVWAACTAYGDDGNGCKGSTGGNGGGRATHYYVRGASWTHRCPWSYGENAYSGSGSYSGIGGTGGSASYSQSRQQVNGNERTVQTHVCDYIPQGNPEKHEGCAAGDWHHSPNPWCNNVACIH